MVYDEFVTQKVEKCSLHHRVNCSSYVERKRMMNWPGRDAGRVTKGCCRGRSFEVEEQHSLLYLRVTRV